MRSTIVANKTRPLALAGILFIVLGAGMRVFPAYAQVLLTPDQLEELVSRVALYPDPLLAQVLTASTYSEQIPDAAEWADQHNYLSGDKLALAIIDDNLSWDPSVLALLPFPSVLDTMSTNMAWTRQLGDAVLGERAEVMQAVQTMRERAHNFGYLQDGSQYHVLESGPGIIEIVPVDPAFYFVPVYDPLIVFGRPRAGLAVGITFSPRIAIGAAFNPWGWGRSGFRWPSRTIVLDGRLWARTRGNRETYRHPYAAPRHQAGPRMERHEVRPAHSNKKKRHREGGR